MFKMSLKISAFKKNLRKKINISIPNNWKFVFLLILTVASSFCVNPFSVRPFWISLPTSSETVSTKKINQATRKNMKAVKFQSNNSWFIISNPKNDAKLI